MKRSTLFILLATCILGIGTISYTQANTRDKNRIFELRTYYVLPNRMDAMNARFRDHTCKLFKKHGMDLVGFWQPEGEEGKKKLIYVLAHASKEAADASWKAFSNDPDWKKAREESEKDGKIVEKLERVYMNPTDYSEMK